MVVFCYVVVLVLYRDYRRQFLVSKALCFRNLSKHQKDKQG